MFDPVPQPHVPLGSRAPSAVHGEGLLPESFVAEQTERVSAIFLADDRLHVGQFSFSVELLDGHLRELRRLCRQVRTVLSNPEILSQRAVEEKCCFSEQWIDPQQALKTFREVQGSDALERSVNEWIGKINTTQPMMKISSRDVQDLRRVAMEGAKLATACCAVEVSVKDAAAARPVGMMAIAWLSDTMRLLLSSGSFQGQSQDAEAFKSFELPYLRIELDILAQRLDLHRDGAGLVYTVCSVEHRAAALLNRGYLTREIVLGDGNMWGEVAVNSHSRRETIFSRNHRIRDVFSGLQLGRAASNLLHSLQNDGIDLVRLCAFIDHKTASGMKMCLERLPSQAHLRLSGVDEWAPRFESGARSSISQEDRHDLGVLLLDAERALLAASYLQGVVTGERNQNLWRERWRLVLSDAEVRVALSLVNEIPTPLSSDCAGAAGVVANAAMLLGYHGDDRTGAGWRVPENPPISLAWAMYGVSTRQV